MSTKTIENKNANNTEADKKTMQNLIKVISDAETALIERGRRATNVAGAYVPDNHWKWR